MHVPSPDLPDYLSGLPNSRLRILPRWKPRNERRHNCRLGVLWFALLAPARWSLLENVFARPPPLHRGVWRLPPPLLGVFLPPSNSLTTMTPPVQLTKFCVFTETQKHSPRSPLADLLNFWRHHHSPPELCRLGDPAPWTPVPVRRRLIPNVPQSFKLFLFPLGIFMKDEL